MLLYKFDWIGFVLFAPACIQLLLALQYGGNQYPWDSATVIGLFCGTVATLLVFIAWERHMGRDAMIPGYLLRDRIVVCCCMFSMMVFGMTMILSYYLPIYFQSVRGKSALVSGVNLLPNILCQLVMAIISGVLSELPLISQISKNSFANCHKQPGNWATISHGESSGQC